MICGSYSEYYRTIILHSFLNWLATSLDVVTTVCTFLQGVAAGVLSD